MLPPFHRWMKRGRRGCLTNPSCSLGRECSCQVQIEEPTQKIEQKWETSERRWLVSKKRGINESARGNALAETPDIRAYDKRALFRDLSLRLYRESNEWHKRQRLMRIIIHSLVVVGLVAVCSCRQPIIQPSTLPTAPSTRQANRPGRQADGSVLLPNQWSLRPVGR